MTEFLIENLNVIVGLLLGLGIIGLRKLADKTETDLDNKALDKVEENKPGIIAKITELLKKLLIKKK